MLKLLGGLVLVSLVAVLFLLLGHLHSGNNSLLLLLCSYHRTLSCCHDEEKLHLGLERT